MTSPIQSVDHLLPSSQHPWIEERQHIYERFLQWCTNNQITLCLPNISIKDIQQSKSDKIIGALLFDVIHDLEYWQTLDQECQRQGKRIWIVTDNLIEDDYFVFENVKLHTYHQLIGITHIGEVDYSPVVHKKLYNCFMQRIESVRQSWFYFLYLYGLLDRGYVSFLLWQLDDYSILRGRDLYDHIHDQYHLKNLPHFERAYHELRPLVPFRNFDDEDLMECIRYSKYSVIVETYAVEDDCRRWSFTEKLMRSLQTPTINLPFMQKHGVRQLRRLGLEFDGFIDAIDSLPWVERQKALLEILVNDTVIYDYRSSRALAMHNAALIGNWKKQYQKQNFFDSLFDRVIAA